MATSKGSKGKATISIEIRGDKGAGKSAVLHEIGAVLKERGYNVACFDCGAMIDPEPIQWAPDSRLIQLSTHDA